MSFSIGTLDNQQMDVLREIGNIGAGNAATALAKMIGRKVDMSIPTTKVLEFKDVADILGGAEKTVVGILLNMTGDMTGKLMFIIDFEASKVLVNILMNRCNHYSVEFDEIEISALSEVGNILSGSYISALSELTGLNIYSSIPDMAIDMAGAILSVPAIEFGKIGDTVLYIETEFSEDDTVVLGEFFLIPDVGSYEILLKALGVLG